MPQTLSPTHHSLLITHITFLRMNSVMLLGYNIMYHHAGQMYGLLVYYNFTPLQLQ